MGDDPPQWGPALIGIAPLAHPSQWRGTEVSVLLSLLSLTATAAPGFAGAVHIGAQPVEPDQAWAGIGGGLLIAAGVGGPTIPAGLVEGGAALSRRTALHAQLMTAGSIGSLGTISGRTLVLDGDQRLAFTLTAVLAGYRTFPEAPMVWQGKLSPGLAVDLGSDRVRFDASAPIYGLISYNQYVGVARFPLPLGGTLGVSYVINDHHRIRLGVPELFSWHVQGDHAYFDVGGLPFLVGGVWMRAGAIF